MIQMDASLLLCFGETKVTLHLAIDDATGKPSLTLIHLLSLRQEAAADS